LDFGANTGKDRERRSGVTIPASKLIGALYMKKGSAEMSPKVKMKTNLSIREKTETCSARRKRRQEDKHREHLNGETRQTVGGGKEKLRLK
jgi:hypothetical protein